MKMKMNEPDILQVIKNLFKVINVKVSQKSLLENIHYRLWSEEDWLNGLSNIIRDCGIDACFINLNFDLLDDLPIYSIIYLQGGIESSESNELFILLEKDEHNVRLLNHNFEELILDISELRSKWSNIVIAIDIDESSKELDYELRLNKQKALSEYLDDGVSVIMPVFNQAHFILRAIKSLFLQSYNNWELIIIDDCSSDNLKETIALFSKDKRVKYFKNENNIGLGASLNIGLTKAKFDLISYLPADDCFFKEHLKSLVEILKTTNASLVYSGVKFFSSKWSNGNYGYYHYGKIQGLWLQLVQVLHIKTNDKWIERNELVTDDLNIMYWNNFFTQHKKIIGTRRITCEWLDHPDQRHKVINESLGGGIFLYKERYSIRYPLRFKSSYGNFIDEKKQYKYLKKMGSPLQLGDNKKLKILLVGDLSYNPERILAFEERGHQLYGLWMKNPAVVNSSGVLPFGNVQQVSILNWKKEIEIIKPDLIYALQDYRAVPLAHHILVNNPGIPFVSHFKESPFHSRDKNNWKQLLELYSISDGQIYTSSLMKDWFHQYMKKENRLSFILDGDMPKKECFSNERSELLSKKDGEIHAVFVGRPMGIYKQEVNEIVKQGIHLHFYGNIFHQSDFFNEILNDFPSYIHLHDTANQDSWVKEFSQYDAGWLHHFQSNNYGELLKLNWHDLNTPARIAQYAMAGIPMLMKNNKGHKVACQDILMNEDMVILYDSIRDIKKCFSNKAKLEEMRMNIWNKRLQFSFDYHVDDLINFFFDVIDFHKKRNCEKKLKTNQFQ